MKHYTNNKIIKNLIFILLVVTAVFLLNRQLAGVNFLKSFSRIFNIFYRMYPLDISIIPSLYQPIYETFLMAFFSSLLGMLTSLLILPFLSDLLFEIKWLSKLLASVLSIFRTIPALIFAAILVSLFGVGSFSGFLSLYIISFLMSTKILMEYVDEINQKYLESAFSQGLSKLQVYKTAILDNIKPAIYSVFFLVLESNIRGASVLGLVGAGGIGQVLWKELNHLRYDRVAVIILFLIIIIVITDLFSYLFRNIDFSKVSHYKKYQFRKNIINLLYFILGFVTVYYVIFLLDINLERLSLGMKQIATMLVGMINPDVSYIIKVAISLVDSLYIAFSSTVLAGVSSIVVSYFAAYNLSGKYSSLLSKIFINILRTFPPIVVAIIFFRGFGPGYISSFFAIYIYTVGTISKMYTEVLEGINQNIIDALDSKGIVRFIAYIKIIFIGYLPEFVSINLYRFEMNIKNSTILGMVGAGGIGQLLVNNIEFRNWNRISVILFVLCITIITIENISKWIRKKIRR